MSDLDLLKANPKNPRKISDPQLEGLRKSLAEFGDLSGVVFNSHTGHLVGGHQRIKAIPPGAEIRIEREYDVPTRTGTVAIGVIVVEGEEFAYRVVDWDEQRELLANIAANHHGGEDDLPKLGELLKELEFSPEDLALSGLTDEEIAAAVAAADQGVEKLPPGGDPDDDTITMPVVPKSKLGDLWTLGQHRLLCGDSTDIVQVDRLLGGARIELCFTSPPYADQREYGGGKELATEHLATFIRCACHATNIFAVNLGYARKSGAVFRYWDDYIKEAEANGLQLLSWNIWDKGQAGSVGNQTAMFAITHEWIFVFGKETKKLNKTHENIWAGEVKDSGIRLKDGSVKYNGKNKVNEFSNMHTVFRHFPYKARNEDLGDHPAVFPVGFPEAYILACTSPEDAVYEPFGGSGTTLMACERQNRRGFVMELDPRYADVILARWARFTGQDPVRDDGVTWSSLQPPA